MKLFLNTRTHDMHCMSRWFDEKDIEYKFGCSFRKDPRNLTGYYVDSHVELNEEDATLFMLYWSKFVIK